MEKNLQTENGVHLNVKGGDVEVFEKDLGSLGSVGVGEKERW